MKHSNLILVLLLIVSTTLSSVAANPAIGFAANRSQLANQSMYITHRNLRSVVTRPFNYQRAVDYDAKCTKYKHLQVGGIVMLSVGVTSLAGGIVLFNFGLNDAYTGGGDLQTVGFVAGGAILTVVGVALTGAGTALTIVGSVKRKKYCNGGTPQSYYTIHPANKGLGIACTF